MTFKQLTEYIAQQEGLKKQINIGQIKEVTRIVLVILANMPLSEAAKLLGKYHEEL